MQIYHSFKNQKPDGPDPSVVRPSSWNAGHVDELGNPINITSAPGVDIRFLMDGQLGRPTYAQWYANQATTVTNSVWTVLLGSNKHIFLPNGIFYTTGITIPASTTDLIIEGGGDTRNLGSTVIQGGTGVTLFTFGNNCLNITFKRITFYNTDIAFLIPPGSLVSQIEFEECTFVTISDKAFSITDISAGGSGGLIKATFRNCYFYLFKYGFHSIQNAEVNNLHFDNCAFENPSNGGYQIYIGGVDNNTINTNISIENSLFGGTSATTSIPIYIGRTGIVTLRNLHFADYGLTGGVNDGLELITLAGDVSNFGPEHLTIENCDIQSNRGSLINMTASGGMGKMKLDGNRLTSLRAGDAIILNANKIGRLISIGDRWSSDTPINPPNQNYFIMPFISGNPLPSGIPLIQYGVIAKFISSGPYNIPGNAPGQVYFVTSGGGLNMYLPIITSVPLGFSVRVKQMDAGYVNIWRNSSSGDLIDGGTYYQLTAQYKHVELVSDGVSNWSVWDTN